MTDKQTRAVLVMNGRGDIGLMNANDTIIGLLPIASGEAKHLVDMMNRVRIPVKDANGYIYWQAVKPTNMPKFESVHKKQEYMFSVYVDMLIGMKSMVDTGICDASITVHMPDKSSPQVQKALKDIEARVNLVSNFIKTHH